MSALEYVPSLWLILLDLEMVKLNSHQCFYSSARADKNEEAFLPPLQFGQKRYFGEVWPFIEPEKTRLSNFIRQMIWSGVAEYIPCSPLEGVFNTPQVVSGIPE